MSNKQKQLLIAVVVAFAAMLLTKLYIDHRVGEYRDKDEIVVLLAKIPIRAGQQLNESMVERRGVPVVYAPRARIKADELSSFHGQVFSTDVAKGDYILQSQFKTLGTVGTTLSEQLKGQNFRAISLPVDETNSLARSIVTGDKVDIALTFQTPQLRQSMSLLLFQNVPVISTGAYSLADQELGVSGTNRYNLLTLRLAAEDAFKLNYARQVGKINVFLRNPEDDSTLDLKPIGNVLDLLTPAEREDLQKKEEQQMQNTKIQEDRFKEQVRQLMELQRTQNR